MWEINMEGQMDYLVRNIFVLVIFYSENESGEKDN